MNVKLDPPTPHSSSNKRAVVYCIEPLCKIGGSTAVDNAKTTGYPDNNMTVMFDLLNCPAAAKEGILVAIAEVHEAHKSFETNDALPLWTIQDTYKWMEMSNGLSLFAQLVHRSFMNNICPVYGGCKQLDGVMKSLILNNVEPGCQQ
jgi:hypothetical protein